jgi:hypothetical protein
MTSVMTGTFIDGDDLKGSFQKAPDRQKELQPRFREPVCD